MVLLAHRHYRDFANDTSRSADAINSLFITLIPNLRQISHNRRHKLINSFKEMVRTLLNPCVPNLFLQELDAGNVLELEGQEPRFLYVMLRGEVTLYKRPEALYEDISQRRIKIDQIDCLTNPKDAGEERLGLPMGTLKGNTLLCEDSIVFRDKLIYSLVTKTKSIVYVIPADQARMLPNECQKAIKLLTMEKYSCFNERVLKTEEFLTQNETKEKIWLAA